jgi:hypothetical protein
MQGRIRVSGSPRRGQVRHSLRIGQIAAPHGFARAVVVPIELIGRRYTSGEQEE